MEFTSPSLDKVFYTLKNNKELIDILKENKYLITKEMLYDDYTKSIADNMSAQIYVNNVETLYALAQVLIDNSSIIKNTSIELLMDNKYCFEAISEAFGLSGITMEYSVYKQIFFTYKYCYISSFFQNNSKMFMPDYDYEMLQDNEAAKAFYDAMMKEFDKMDSIIGECLQYKDFDKIPYDLINYLTQLLGFEKQTFSAYEEDTDTEMKFRELAKNILDIYRIKGTNYSFQLFFNFLGYNVEIKEYYFDRRLYYNTTGGNAETSSSNDTEKEYYMTTSNPSDNILQNITIKEVVKPNDITTQYSLLEFEKLVNDYGIEAVLGYSPYDNNGNLYTGKVYKYFKTNYIYYTISLEDGNLTSAQISAVSKYLEFLTPSYVLKDLEVNIYSSKDTEPIAFNGDGTYTPDAYGDFQNGFQMLDSEDWDQSQKDLYITSNGKVSNEKESTGAYADINGTVTEQQDTYLQYYNSLGGKDFRQPLGHKYINKSLNKYLGKGTGAAYPIAKRIRHYITYTSSEGNTVYNYNDSDITATYHYEVPPEVGYSYNNVTNEWFEGKESLVFTDLIGSDKSIREDIKNMNNYKEIDYCTNLSISDYLNNKSSLINSLKYTKTSLYVFNKIITIQYGAGNTYTSELKAYRYLVNSGYMFSNVDDTNDSTILNSITNNSLIIGEYYKSREFMKKLSYGCYIVSYTGTSSAGAIYVYRYAQPDYPIKTSDSYDSKYGIYINSFKYILNPIDGPGNNKSLDASSSGLEIVTYDTIANAQTALNTMYQNMVASASTANKLDLDYISTNTLYYITEEDKYYIPTKTSVKSNNSSYMISHYILTSDTQFNSSKKYYIMTDENSYSFSLIPSSDYHLYTSMENIYEISVINNKSFSKLANAEAYFTAYPEDIYNNSQFYCNGYTYGYDIPTDITSVKENNILSNCLYRWQYYNRNKNTTVYSTMDKKLYRLASATTYNSEDFYGKIVFKSYKLTSDTIYNTGKTYYYLSGNEFHINTDINTALNTLYEVSDGAGTDTGIIIKAYLYEYDSSYKGYSEEDDSDNFIPYNNEHYINWYNLGITKNITRPVKTNTDEEIISSEKIKLPSYPSLINTTSTEDFNTELIKEICNDTAENFSDYEKYSTEEWDNNNHYFKGLLYNIEYAVEGSNHNSAYNYYSSIRKFFIDYYNIVLRAGYLESQISENDIIESGVSKEDYIWSHISKPEIFNGITLGDIQIKLSSAYTKIKATVPEIINSKNYYIYLTKGYASGVSYNLSSLSNLISIAIKTEMVYLWSIYGKNNVLIDFASAGLEPGTNDIFTEEGVPLGNDAYPFESGMFQSSVYFTAGSNEYTPENTNVGCYYLIDTHFNVYLIYRMIISSSAYNKDSYGEHRDIYSKFMEFCDSFNNIDNADIFLKQYYYDNLLKKYREKFIDDESSGLTQELIGKSLMKIYPKLTEKLDGKAGTLRFPTTLLSASNNKGGGIYQTVKIPFFEFNSSRNATSNGIIMNFYVDRNKFITAAGEDFSEFYRKDTIDNLSGTNIEINAENESIQEIYKKFLRSIKPHFFFNTNGITDTTYITQFNQQFRKYIEKDYTDSTIKVVDTNHYPIYDSNGNVIDTNGNILAYGGTAAANRQKEGIYFEIIIEDKDINLSFTSISGISGKKIVNNTVIETIYGYFDFRKLKQELKDNYISYPMSTSWVNKDSSGMPTEYSSFGDDRNFTCNIINRYLDGFSTVVNGETVSKTADEIYTEYIFNDLQNNVLDSSNATVVKYSNGYPVILVNGVETEYTSHDAKKLLNDEVGAENIVEFIPSDINGNPIIINGGGGEPEKKSVIPDNIWNWNNIKDYFMESYQDANGNVILKTNAMHLSNIQKLIVDYTIMYIKLIFKGINNAYKIAKTKVNIIKNILFNSININNTTSKPELNLLKLIKYILNYNVNINNDFTSTGKQIKYIINIMPEINSNSFISSVYNLNSINISNKIENILFNMNLLIHFRLTNVINTINNTVERLFKANTVSINSNRAINSEFKLAEQISLKKINILSIIYEKAGILKNVNLNTVNLNKHIIGYLAIIYILFSDDIEISNIINNVSGKLLNETITGKTVGYSIANPYAAIFIDGQPSAYVQNEVLVMPNGSVSNEIFTSVIGNVSSENLSL